MDWESQSQGACMFRESERGRSEDVQNGTELPGKPGTTASFQLLQQAVDFRQQGREIAGDHAPNRRVVDGVVTVNDAVAKTDNPGEVSDALRQFRLDPGEARQSFADDFEFAFDCAAKLAVAFVFGKGPPGAPPLNGPAESATSRSSWLGGIIDGLPRGRDDRSQAAPA
jgi:hypothetical protein